MAKSILFSWHETKKIKSKKHADLGPKLEKLASILKMNITKMGKTLKSKKFLIIFTF